jgi:hypothetical protein
MNEWACEFPPCSRVASRRIGGRNYCRSHFFVVKKLRENAVDGVFGRPNPEVICLLMKWREK